MLTASPHTPSRRRGSSRGAGSSPWPPSPARASGSSLLRSSDFLSWCALTCLCCADLLLQGVDEFRPRNPVGVFGVDEDRLRDRPAADDVGAAVLPLGAGDRVPLAVDLAVLVAALLDLDPLLRVLELVLGHDPTEDQQIAGYPGHIGAVGERVLFGNGLSQGFVITSPAGLQVGLHLLLGVETEDLVAVTDVLLSHLASWWS